MKLGETAIIVVSRVVATTAMLLIVLGAMVTLGYIESITVVPRSVPVFAVFFGGALGLMVNMMIRRRMPRWLTRRMEPRS